MFSAALCIDCAWNRMDWVGSVLRDVGEAFQAVDPRAMRPVTAVELPLRVGKARPS